MELSELHSRLAALRRACASRGTTAWGGQANVYIEIRNPAAARDVTRVERQLGQRLPPSLRHFFLNVASRIDIGWFLADGQMPPSPFDDIFSGTLTVDLAELESLKVSHQTWVQTCFKSPEQPYNRVWHNTLPILHVDNGDFIAVEIQEGSERVCYLSHEGSERNGFVLGETFDDYLDRFSQLAFVGPEEWQWEAFVDDLERVNPLGSASASWRDWFGLGLETQ